MIAPSPPSPSSPAPSARSKAEAKARKADWPLIELKLDRLIDEMRFLKSHTIAFEAAP